VYSTTAEFLFYIFIIQLTLGEKFYNQEEDWGPGPVEIDVKVVRDPQEGWVDREIYVGPTKCI
jgi:hypothetical protein